jgi:hypothetical protein
LLDPRFPYSPHEDVGKIKALRREREKVKSQQILIRRQRDRTMHKLIMKAAQGDERFLMKDINCNFEYEMLKRMRARAERDKVEEAVIKIQRWWKTIKSKRLFKFIVRLLFFTYLNKEPNA